MTANLNKAVKEYGTSEFSRWMLDDGQFLGVPGYEDHRIVSQFCTLSWLDFLKKNCVSLHYDGSCGYLWLRVNGDLNFQQRQSFKRLFEDDIINVSELKVDLYDGDKWTGENLKISDYLCQLWLTDIISYNVEVNSYEEYGE